MKTIRHLHYRHLYVSDELDTRSLYLPALSVEVRHPVEQKTIGQVSAIELKVLREDGAMHTECMKKG